MRTLTLAAALAVSAFAAATTVQAMPLPRTGPTSSDIVQVRDGCGPGGHRTPYGRCVPNYAPRPYRACPPGLHLGRFGRCVPNY